MTYFQSLALGIALTALLQAPAHANWPDSEKQTLTDTIQGGDYGTVTSLLVTQKDKILYEHYFRGTNENTLHNTRSATKTIIGLLVGTAISDGLIAGTDESVTTFFPDLRPYKHPDQRKDAITLEDFLTMSSKLECNDFNPYSRGNEERMYIIEDWVKFTLDLPIKGYAPWEPRPEASPYGRSFSYCSAGVHTLGQIVARASDKPLSAYAQERLFTPLGISNSTWPKTALDRNGAAGGLELTTQALAKVGSLYNSGGTFEGTRLVSESWIEVSLKSHAETGDGHEYGYLIWKKTVEVAGEQVTLNFMSGNGGNKVAFVPELELVIVLTKTDFNRGSAHRQAEKLMVDEILGRVLTPKN